MIRFDPAQYNINIDALFWSQYLYVEPVSEIRSYKEWLLTRGVVVKNDAYYFLTEESYHQFLLQYG